MQSRACSKTLPAWCHETRVAQLCLGPELLYRPPSGVVRQAKPHEALCRWPHSRAHLGDGGAEVGVHSHQVQPVLLADAVQEPLQVAVADAELGAGQARGHVCVHLHAGADCRAEPQAGETRELWSGSGDSEIWEWGCCRCQSLSCACGPGKADAVRACSVDTVHAPHCRCLHCCLRVSLCRQVDAALGVLSQHPRYHQQYSCDSMYAAD